MFFNQNPISAQSYIIVIKSQIKEVCLPSNVVIIRDSWNVCDARLSIRRWVTNHIKSLSLSLCICLLCYAWVYWLNIIHKQLEESYVFRNLLPFFKQLLYIYIYYKRICKCISGYGNDRDFSHKSAFSW